MKIGKFFPRLGVAALASTALLLSACGSPAATTPATPGSTETPTAQVSETPEAKALTIGLVMLQGDEYFRNIEMGLQEAVQADGGTVIAANSTNDPGTEASAVQNMIQRQIDALLIQPVSGDASVATMKLAADAGIPVICYGNCGGPTVDPALVKGAAQSDNTDLGAATGRAAAEYIKANLDGAAKIGILNCDSAAETCKLRKAGFKAALEEAGINADYVADQEGYLADKATPVATNMLSASPEINLLWAANEGGTVGLVTAVKASGNRVAVFGTDISEQIAGFVLAEDDILQATTGQDPVGTVQAAYQMAKNAIAGQANDPTEQLVPGVTYSRADTATVEAYLAGLGG